MTIFKSSLAVGVKELIYLLFVIQLKINFHLNSFIMLKNLLFTIFALCAITSTLKAQCPVAAYAGLDKTICQGDTIKVIGNVTNGTPVWSAQAQPPTVIFGFPIPGSGVSPVRFVKVGNNDTTNNDTVHITVGAVFTTSVTATPPSYRLYYTITSTGCPTSVDSMQVVVNPLPTATIVAPAGGGGANQTSCTGAATFTVTARKPATGSTGVWSIVAPGTGTVTQATPNDSIGIVTGLATGATILKWTVVNNGTSCTAARTMTITVGTGTPTVAIAGNNMTGCVGDTLKLIGSIATSGTPRWSNANPPAAGPGINVGGFTLPGVTPKSIRFTPNANNDTVKVILDTAGTFKLYYTISIGTATVGSACTSRDSMNITVTKCATTGITENSNGGFVISVRPNPASGLFYLSLKDTQTGVAEMLVLTPDGRTIITEQLGSVKDIDKAINISNLPNGIYFVEVIKGGNIRNIKLVVQQ